jgi:hypothetical protein
LLSVGRHEHLWYITQEGGFAMADSSASEEMDAINADVVTALVGEAIRVNASHIKRGWT